MNSGTFSAYPWFYKKRATISCSDGTNTYESDLVRVYLFKNPIESPMDIELVDALEVSTEITDDNSYKSTGVLSLVQNAYEFLDSGIAITTNIDTAVTEFSSDGGTINLCLVTPPTTLTISHTETNPSEVLFTVPGSPTVEYSTQLTFNVDVLGQTISCDIRDVAMNSPVEEQSFLLLESSDSGSLDLREVAADHSI